MTNLMKIPGPALIGLDHLFADSIKILPGDDSMMGLDYLGVDDSPQRATDPLLGAVAPQVAQWDEVTAPAQVTLSPRSAGSTVFGDILRGIPSGVARVAVSGGRYWKPDPAFESNGNAWDDSAGGSPTARVYFANGQQATFARLQSIDIRGGVLRRGVVQRSWLMRALGAGK